MKKPHSEAGARSEPKYRISYDFEEWAGRVEMPSVSGRRFDAQAYIQAFLQIDPRVVRIEINFNILTICKRNEQSQWRVSDCYGIGEWLTVPEAPPGQVEWRRLLAIPNPKPKRW